MRVLVDTNVLLRLSDPTHPMRPEAESAVAELNRRGHAAVLVPQVVYEYWVVATRPAAVNGLGMTTAAADVTTEEWLKVFPVFLDERGVFVHWRSLVVANDVKAKNAHDARLVAAMARHGLTHLITYNVADFARFARVTALLPAEVAAGRLPA